MMDLVEEVEHIVGVRIVEDKTKEIPRPKQPKEIRATFKTATLSNTLDPVMLLGHAPNRRRALLQFTTAGPIVLGPDRASVQKADNTCATINVAAAGIIELTATTEVWATSTVAGLTNAAVIAEYEVD